MDIDKPPFQIVTDEEAAEADFTVCVRADEQTPFKNNRFGVCAHCRCAIQFRPSMPEGPTKICMQCAIDRMGGGTA